MDLAKLKETAKGFLGKGQARQASEKEADYRARQKAALDAIEASSDDGSRGTDAGELGKKWDEEFK